MGRKEEEKKRFYPGAAVRLFLSKSYLECETMDSEGKDCQENVGDTL